MRAEQYAGSSQRRRSSQHRPVSRETEWARLAVDGHKVTLGSQQSRGNTPAWTLWRMEVREDVRRGDGFAVSFCNIRAGFPSDAGDLQRPSLAAGCPCAAARLVEGDMQYSWGPSPLIWRARGRTRRVLAQRTSSRVHAASACERRLGVYLSREPKAPSTAPARGRGVPGRRCVIVALGTSV